MVFSDGKVVWSPGGAIEITCPLNTRKFPFDTQTCVILLEPEKYYFQLEQFQMPKKVQVARSNFQGTWEIMQMWAESQTTNNSGGQFSHVLAYLTLKRKPLYFIINIMVPCVVLGFLNIFTFVLPSKSGAKVSLGIAITMSYFIFLIIIEEYLPQNSDHIPLFAIYLCLMTMLSALSVVCSTGIFSAISFPCFPKQKLSTLLQATLHLFSTTKASKLKMPVEVQRQPKHSSDENKTKELSNPKTDRQRSFLDKMFCLFFTLTFFISTGAFFSSVLL